MVTNDIRALAQSVWDREEGSIGILADALEEMGQDTTRMRSGLIKNRSPEILALIYPDPDEYTRQEAEYMTTLSGWDIAEWCGCYYSGDSDPLNHGGYFYNLTNWERKRWNYADFVELIPVQDGKEEKVIVSEGTIHNGSLQSAFRCLGIEDVDTSDPHMQVEACKCYFGAESNYEKTYTLANWKEWRLWKRILPLIKAMD